MFFKLDLKRRIIDTITQIMIIIGYNPFKGWDKGIIKWQLVINDTWAVDIATTKIGKYLAKKANAKLRKMNNF